MMYICFARPQWFKHRHVYDILFQVMKRAVTSVRCITAPVMIVCPIAKVNYRIDFFEIWMCMIMWCFKRMHKRLRKLNMWEKDPSNNDNKCKGYVKKFISIRSTYILTEEKHWLWTCMAGITQYVFVTHKFFIYISARILNEEISYNHLFSPILSSVW